MNLKTNKMKYILLLILLVSCSAKTTTKNESKNDSLAKTKETATASINEVEKTTTKSDSSSTSKKELEFISFLNELEFEPADPTKESSITENGKTTTFKNLKGKKRNSSTKSKESSSAYVNLIKTKNIELKRKNDLLFEKSLEVQRLQIENSQLSKREQFNWGTFIFSLWWLWILILIALWLGWKYYKGVNPFVGITEYFKD